MFKFLLAFLALAVAAPAIAVEASPNPGQQKPKKEPKICKKIEQTSSRMPKSICKTAAEWNGTNSADALERLNSNPAVQTPG